MSRPLPFMRSFGSRPALREMLLGVNPSFFESVYPTLAAQPFAKRRDIASTSPVIASESPR